MAIVYRVENWEGFGPYSRIAPRFQYSSHLHPEPDLEGLSVDDSMSFGFADFFRLMLWFSAEEIQTLGSWGEEWLVSKYSVAEGHLQSSSTQTVFRRDEAELLGCLPLSELGAVKRQHCTRKVADRLERRLEARFESHAPCGPAQQHISISEGYCETGESSDLIRSQLTNLREGCYYSIDGYDHVYRNGLIYEIDDDHDLVEADLSYLNEVASEIVHITPKSIR